MRRPTARPISRATHCRGCGARHDHHLLFEPAAYHALAVHRKVFCSSCGGLAFYVPRGLTTAA